MDERASILGQLEGSYQLVKYLIGDVSDDEASHVPTSNLAPIIWQVGHLAFADYNLSNIAGGVCSIPENYANLFGIGMWTGDCTGYPEFGTVVETFDASHQSLVRCAKHADFATPLSGFQRYFKTFGEALIFFCTHRGYHAGKVSTLRSLLGKPGVWTAADSVDLLKSRLVLPGD